MTLVINTEDFRKEIQRLVLKLGVPNKYIRKFWSVLAVKFDQNTKQTFKGLGYRGYGTEKWPGYSPYTLHPVTNGKLNYNLWNRRPGTDGSAKRTYSASSQLLQASGLFKASFRVQSANNNKIEYGTRHELAKDIMKNRPVLTVTDDDRDRIKKSYLSFYTQALKNK